MNYLAIYLVAWFAGLAVLIVYWQVELGVAMVAMVLLGVTAPALGDLVDLLKRRPARSDGD